MLFILPQLESYWKLPYEVAPLGNGWILRHYKRFLANVELENGDQAVGQERKRWPRIW